jgi:DNA-binding LacI/PurR family transcriptional regulator
MDLRELAAQLGLSMTTVSRALNGYPEVSAKTRERVVAAAEAVGYRANAVARRLATGRSDAVALVLAMPDDRLLPVAALMVMPLVGEQLRGDNLDLFVVPAPPVEVVAAGGRLIQGGRADVLINLSVACVEGGVRISLKNGDESLLELDDPASLDPVAPAVAAAVAAQMKLEPSQRKPLVLTIKGGPYLKAEKTPNEKLAPVAATANDRRSGRDRRAGG